MQALSDARSMHKSPGTPSFLDENYHVTVKWLHIFHIMFTIDLYNSSQSKFQIKYLSEYFYFCFVTFCSGSQLM